MDQKNSFEVVFYNCSSSIFVENFRFYRIYIHLIVQALGWDDRLNNTIRGEYIPSEFLVICIDLVRCSNTGAWRKGMEPIKKYPEEISEIFKFLILLNDSILLTEL